MNSKLLILAGILSLVATAGNAQYTLTDGTNVAPLNTFQECDVCPEMIVLPVGDFVMGGPIGDSISGLVVIDGKLAMVDVGHPAIGADERPLHRVEIDIPFAMGRNEVTYEQWMACVEDGWCERTPENVILGIDENRKTTRTPVYGKHPVIDVTFHDANQYVAWLNQKTGAETYRLPTEAEWEYAARAGTQTRFAQGDELTSDQANFYGRGTEKQTGVPRPDLLSRLVPVPVNELDAANEWGVRHMSGNVIEQTRSCYTSEYAGWTLTSEWLRQSELGSCKRVFRGGGFNTSMDSVRVASRGAGLQSLRSQYSGFRVLREMN